MDGITDNFNPGSLTIMDNISINNQRFNYIIRQNPYGSMLRPAYISNNVSLHLDKGEHLSDAVHSNKKNHNEFYSNNKNDTEYSEVKLNNIVSRSVKNESEAHEQIKLIRNLLY